jgi:hypothetical protein
MRNLRDQVAAARIALPMNKHLAILHRSNLAALRGIANSEVVTEKSGLIPDYPVTF